MVIEGQSGCHAMSFLPECKEALAFLPLLWLSFPGRRVLFTYCRSLNMGTLWYQYSNVGIQNSTRRAIPSPSGPPPFPYAHWLPNIHG